VSPNINFDVSGTILIIDDDLITLEIHRSALSGQFEIDAASSGKQALQICSESLPDLILLDVRMPEMDGYETCARLREFTDVPIIFVTATETLEEHLKAFDVGGDDIIFKPIIKDLLLRKASLAIHRKNERLKLGSENKSSLNERMKFFSSAGEAGVLQRFTKACLTSNSVKDIGNHLLAAMNNFKLDSCVLIRNDEDTTIISSHGAPSPIELSILESPGSTGRLFQYKHRLLINYDRISVLVSNMPQEEDEYSSAILDNIVMLVELTETLCENAEMRLKSISQTEQMQVALQTAYNETETVNRLRHNSQADLRLLLQDLVDSVESTYTWLGTSNSQEESISKAMYDSIDKILNVLEETGQQYDNGFQTILSLLNAEDFGGEIHLF
jgi:CheY-like chemotaxis protein